MGKVSFDGLWLDLTSERGNPFHNGRLRCGEGGRVAESVSSAELDEGALACRVGTASAGCESMPKVERHLGGVLAVGLIPHCRWGFKVGFLFKWGASAKSLEYKKRDAKSASAFSADDNQTAEKVKLSSAVIIRKPRRSCIVGGD